jgi:hypothetical protein
VVGARHVRDVEIGAKKGGSELPDKLLHRMGVVAEMYFLFNGIIFVAFAAPPFCKHHFRVLRVPQSELEIDKLAVAADGPQGEPGQNADGYSPFPVARYFDR